MEVSLDIGPPVRHSIGRPRRLNRHYTAVPANFRLGFRHSRVPLVERIPDTRGETGTKLSLGGRAIKEMCRLGTVLTPPIVLPAPPASWL